MDLILSAVNSKSDQRDANVIRPLANFHPNIWGDTFYHYTPLDQDVQKQEEQEVRLLKDKVRKELWMPIANDPKHRLLLLDAIERLGVAYHFEQELEANFQQFQKNCFGGSYDNDLHYVSLRFRLLRQHGIYVSCDVFDNFKDKNGSFKESLRRDVEGILSLYEASHLRLHGEDVLDDALCFTTTLLTSLANCSSSPLAEQIAHALKRPLYKCATRLGAKYQITVYESDPSHHQDLLRLAKLDFNLLQILHKKELSELIRWARNLDFTGKFPFARDRIVECYYWALGVCYEPKYSEARSIITKFGEIVTLMDDIYDSYGIIKELEPFTNAILGGNKTCVSQLPDYMKLFYQIVLDTFQELEQELANQGRSYAVNYLLNEFKAISEAYLQEARWCDEKYIPTYDEYIKIASITCTYSVMIMAAYQGMGQIATKEALEWLTHNSKAIKASCIFARILNDLAGHKSQKKRDHVASTVDCYMSSFNVSEEEAYKELEKEMEGKWKDIRAEMFRPTAVPMPLLTRILNASKGVYDLYEIGEDGFTTSEYIKSKIVALLIQPAI